MLRRILTAVLLTLGVAIVQAADIGYVADSRNFTMFEVVTSTSITRDLTFWGFTDLYSRQNTGSDQFDITDHFMEYRLDYNIFQMYREWIPYRPLFVEAEYNGFTGPGNDLVRLGLNYTQKFKYTDSWWSIRYFPWDTRADKHEHYSFTHHFKLNNRFTFFGFYDYHRLDGLKNAWYTEPSLIYEFNKTYSAILIWRYDGFLEDVPGERTTGLAAGIYMKL